MDPASQALTEALAKDGSISYRGLADRKNTKAQLQQYLTPEEEKAMVKFLLLTSSLRHPVRVKFIPSLAFGIARRPSTAIRSIKPPGKNWAQAFEKRHRELKARRVRAINWKRHENNIYPKMT
ncbi:hypothetical protein EJ02DRAFT_312963, partial [Clathrospora elynae]